MAVTFLEPSGDADFQVATGNGFWGSIQGSPAIATDFVHGNHKKSIKYPTGGFNYVHTAPSILNDAGSRVSIYFYLNALPASGTGKLLTFDQSGLANIINLRVTSAGVLRLDQVDTVIANGPTLVTGRWYRISIAYTITSITVNEFRIFVDGILAISASNATLTNASTSILTVGNVSSNDIDFRSSDHYIDNSNSLTDTGDIWVTAKRPNANGTTNGFTTQIGSGGSGYGTGHSPQVNERPLSTTNGWSIVGAGSAITEEYSIESKSTGDIDISSEVIADYMGWVSASSLAGETASVIVGGVSSNISLTSSAKIFTKIAGSTTYPSGNTDIGLITSTTLTTVSLYEAGIVVAYILPVSVTVTPSTLSISSSINSPTISAIRNINVSVGIQNISTSLKSPILPNATMLPSILTINGTGSNPVILTNSSTFYNSSSYTYNSPIPYQGIASVNIENSNLIINSLARTVIVSLPKTVIVSLLTINSLINPVTVSTTRNVITIPSILSIASALNSVSISIAKTANAGLLTITSSLNSPIISTQRQITITISNLISNIILNPVTVTVTRNYDILTKIESDIRNIIPTPNIYAVPINGSINSINPSGKSAKSGNAGNIDNGLTYNQSGYTYNDTRGIYGGYYGSSDGFEGRLKVYEAKPVFITL